MLGRRADGFHEIVTVLQSVTLADQLTFGPRADGRVTLTYEGLPQIPLDETNLVMRAARALRERYNAAAGAEIHLAKQIPAGGGLGGGSSNAAAALLGLARLWELPATLAELSVIGAGLGADVPFFLRGGTVLGTGLGTDLETLPDAPPQLLVILAPGAGVATASAYQALRAPVLTKKDALHILRVSREARGIGESIPEGLHNDFERVVLAEKPEIARAKAALLQAKARAALLSGSGSSVFGVFDNELARQSALAWLQANGEANWRAFACETQTQTAYRQALGLSG